MATKGARLRSRDGGGEDFKKEKGEEIFAMPIIFKQLSTGPQTRISKMENARPFPAVGM